jgi:hypothetical protein
MTTTAAMALSQMEAIWGGKHWTIAIPGQWCLPALQKYIGMSNTIHFTGKVIVSRQMSCTSADVHSIEVDGGLMDLIAIREFTNKQSLLSSLGNATNYR